MTDVMIKQSWFKALELAEGYVRAAAYTEVSSPPYAHGKAHEHLATVQAALAEMQKEPENETSALMLEALIERAFGDKTVRTKDGVLRTCGFDLSAVAREIASKVNTALAGDHAQQTQDDPVEPGTLRHALRSIGAVRGPVEEVLHAKLAAVAPHGRDEIESCLFYIEKAAERLEQAAEIDAPPTIYRGEAKLILNRVREIRNALASDEGRKP